ncbi:hypothetical protein, partial [Rodentibacter caecimuris]|uniref:hypothetical protein n=1 Tax=Rodentibacter caecimuris TaxID=1796644 RepID=UPI002248C8A0
AMRFDDVFGPRLPGAFDFTILFEQSILSLLPTAIFIILAPWRTLQISRRITVVRTGPLLWCKLVSGARQVLESIQLKAWLLIRGY